MRKEKIREFAMRLCDVFSVAHGFALTWLMIWYALADDGEINFLRAFIAIVYCMIMSLGLQWLSMKFYVDERTN